MFSTGPVVNLGQSGGIRIVDHAKSAVGPFLENVFRILSHPPGGEIHGRTHHTPPDGPGESCAHGTTVSEMLNNFFDRPGQCPRGCGIGGGQVKWIPLHRSGGKVDQGSLDSGSPDINSQDGHTVGEHALSPFGATPQFLNLLTTSSIPRGNNLGRILVIAPISAIFSCEMDNPAKLQEELEGYCGLGMYDEALARINRARRKGDHSLTLAFLRTRILRAAGRFLELRKTAERLRRLRPEEPEVWVSLADAVRHHDSLQHGRSILLEAERKFPDNPHIKFQLGCYHCQLQDLEKARSYVQAAIRIDQAWADAAKEDKDLAPLRQKI